MPSDDEREEAAGQPAAGLFAHLISQAGRLDEHRRRLAAGNEELAGLLFGIEQTALHQVYEQIQGGRSWSSSPQSSASRSSGPEYSSWAPSSSRSASAK